MALFASGVELGETAIERPALVVREDMETTR